MTSCIVGKKIRAMGPGPLELFPFVVLAILMAMAFICVIKYGIYANIFAQKNVSSFCICKSYSHLFSKNNCELVIVLTRTVNILTSNELVKLTTL